MNSRHKRNHIFPGLLLAVSVCLAGCADRTASKESAPEEPLAQQTMDWSAYQIAPIQNVETAAQWYLREYHDDWIAPSDREYDIFPMYDGLPGGNIYRYTCDNTENGIINIFDARTGQSFRTEPSTAGWGLPENGILTDMTMADEQTAVFLVRSFGESGTPLSCCSMVFYHMEEEVQKTVDLLPALTAAGITEHTGYSIDPTAKSILCDPDGCCYLLWENKLIVASGAGELLCDMEQTGEVTLSFLCRTPEGYPLFVRTDMENRVNTYWIYDRSAGEMRSLGETKYMALKYGCMDTAGNLYYFSNDKIVRWNTRSGDRETIFDCSANHICSNTTALKVTCIRENGDLVIMDSITENQNIYVLSPAAPESERTLTVVSACSGTQVEQTAAALFSMKNPGVHIEFSGVDTDLSGPVTRADHDEYTTNLINRIVAGDAPDMCIVSEETMRVLYEKGALADLTGMIPGQVKEQVFDCVWNAGTIDGKLIGLTTDLSCSSIMVSDELWPRDTWTLEDILALAEDAQGNALEGLIPLKGFNPQPTDIVQWLALKNIDAPLVDWENGVCHFDSPVFRRLLEYCKNTPVPQPNPDSQDRAPARSVQNGEYLAYACDIYDIHDFSFQMSLLGEGFHWVGIPTHGECGNQVYATNFLVVSKDTENMDLIREFLPTLYGDELERLYPDNCLRRDVLRNRVIDASEWNPKAQFRQDEGVYLQLECKPDGTSYVEEYIAFMDSCVLMPAGDDTIASIVLEEIPAYFSEDKNMDKVIDIIQSRVQIYLDETSE